MSNPALAAYGKRDDLAAYGSNGLLLFALQLQFGMDDIESVAADALTDGNNDKKCDLVYVDRDRGRLVIAQGYEAKSPGTKTAPASKASDLNTAVAWLLSGDVNGLPDNLKSAAIHVRGAISDQTIREIDLWYVHNQNESTNVRDELQQAARTAKSIVASGFPDAQVTSIVGREIGQATLAELYKRTRAPIAVSDSFRVPVSGGFTISAEHWRAFCTSVPGSWLRSVWKEHETNLLSPNVRDYLGIVKAERNINFGIKSTARQDPNQFWIYNNGLTILVNDFRLVPSPDRGDAEDLEITGIGIVNGAQTTGSIGTLADAEAEGIESLNVMARFVKCDSPAILAEIVRYNNTQNKVEAADFRSKDVVQERLRAEFAQIPEATYRGGRRGGVSDAIERQKNLVADGAVAQSLAAFHGRPNLAYNDTRRIWDDDGTYADLFNERTSARHIVFTYALLRAVEAAKKEIADLDEKVRTQSQQRQISFFRQRGAIQLFVAAVAESMEAILGYAVVDRFGLSFGTECSPKDAITHWSPVVQACLPFCDRLSDAADRNLQNAEKVRQAIQTFQSLIEATGTANRPLYESFSSLVRTS
ncbi:AIPR family protein [Micromonospora chalcea]|uniref:AIPR family protein n=1 Tax=Micromonospora chalcea TaxID=1874 RepID=UPI0033C0E0F5